MGDRLPAPQSSLSGESKSETSRNGMPRRVSPVANHSVAAPPDESRSSSEIPRISGQFIDSTSIAKSAAIISNRFASVFRCPFSALTILSGRQSSGSGLQSPLVQRQIEFR